MRLWSALFGRSEKRFGWDDYLEQYSTLLNNGGFAYGLSPTGTAEQVENSYRGYINAAYKSNGIVFACMLARRLLFSEAEFGFQQRSARLGESMDLDHPELKILEKPWPGGTTGDLLSRMIQDADLAGNFYAVRQGKRLRRLRPDWVQIVMTADPRLEAEVDVMGYLYWPGGLNQGEPTAYLPDETVHWSPEPDPDAEFRGMSWLTPVLREIQADKYATEHKLKFFTNGAALRAIVSMKETVTEAQFAKLAKRFAETHQGTDNAYRTAVVGGGATVNVVGADLKQIDFRSVQSAGENRIAADSGIHPVIVGLSDSLTGSSLNEGNFNAARRLTADKLLRPLWKSAAAALSHVLLVPRGKRLRVDEANIAFLREDRADIAKIQSMEAATIVALGNGGWVPNSARDAVKRGDWDVLEHSGNLSVQLQPADGDAPDPPSRPDTDTDDSPDGGADGNPA